MHAVCTPLLFFFFFCLVLISFMSFHCDTCTSAVVFLFVLCSRVLCVMLAVRPALSFQCDACTRTNCNASVYQSDETTCFFRCFSSPVSSFSAESKQKKVSKHTHTFAVLIEYLANVCVVLAVRPALCFHCDSLSLSLSLSHTHTNCKSMSIPKE